MRHIRRLKIYQSLCKGEEVCAIVAADNNWGIGYQNRLLVSIPSDMKFFRQKTTGNVVVMGRKTLEKFPKRTSFEE